MSVTALIDRISPWASGWARTGTRSILRLIQEGQDEAVDYDAPSFIWIGTENKGFPPYLTTVAGTYRYDVSAANLTSVSSITKTLGGSSVTVRARRVTKVFVDPNTDYDSLRTWVGYPYATGFNNPYRSSNDRVGVAEIPIRSYPALENDVAVIEFLEDPGSTTDRYFCEFYYEPPALSSESIPLVIPARFEIALEDYAIGKIQQFENGSWNERLDRFYNGVSNNPSWIDQIRTYMSQGPQNTNYDTQLIDC
ncbi:MAG: hypothetical protein KJ899_15375 [Gammaproteobacteria bacterium]|nr:hypothetical protein [Gammaproteobacteria bacterium]